VDPVSSVEEEPISTMHHGPAKIEETSWGTYKHTHHLGDDTVSLSETPSLMEDEDELREIIQNTISDEQEVKKEQKVEKVTDLEDSDATRFLSLFDNRHHSDELREIIQSTISDEQKVKKEQKVEKATDLEDSDETRFLSLFDNRYFH